MSTQESTFFSTKEESTVEKRRKQLEYHAGSPKKLPELIVSRSLPSLPQKYRKLLHGNYLSSDDDFGNTQTQIENLSRIVKQSNERVADLRELLSSSITQINGEMISHFDKFSENTLKLNRLFASEESSRLARERELTQKIENLQQRCSRDLDELRGLVLSQLSDSLKLDDSEKKGQWDAILAAERRSKESFSVVEELSRNEMKRTADIQELKKSLELLRSFVYERVEHLENNMGIDGPQRTEESSLSSQNNLHENRLRIESYQQLTQVQYELAEMKQNLLHFELTWKDSISECFRIQNNLNAERESLLSAHHEVRSVLSAEVQARREQRERDREAMIGIVERYEGLFQGLRREVKGAVDQLNIRTTSLESSVKVLAEGLTEQLDDLQASTRNAVGSLRIDVNALQGKVLRCLSGQELVTQACNDNFSRLLARTEALENTINMKEDGETSKRASLVGKEEFDRRNRDFQKSLDDFHENLKELQRRSDLQNLENIAAASTVHQTLAMEVERMKGELHRTVDSLAVLKEKMQVTSAEKGNTAESEALRTMVQKSSEQLKSMMNKLQVEVQDLTSKYSVEVPSIERTLQHDVEVISSMRFLSGRVEILEQLYNSGSRRQSSVPPEASSEPPKGDSTQIINEFRTKVESELKSLTEIITDLQRRYQSERDLLSNDLKSKDRSMNSIKLEAKKDIDKAKEEVVSYTSTLKADILKTAKEESNNIKKLLASKLQQEQKERDEAIQRIHQRIIQDLAEVLKDYQRIHDDDDESETSTT